MVSALQRWDESLFYAINHGLASPWLDAVMPWFSANPIFLPALAALGVWLFWKGGARGRLCVLFLLLWVLVANNLAVGWLKDFFNRPRPFLTLEDARLLVGRGRSAAMPSGHAANWFAALGVVWWFYPRALWGLTPIALAVAFSRIYVGVHYPSDILGGAVLGLTLGLGGPWLSDLLWRRAGRCWFPLWQRRLPRLIRPASSQDPMRPEPAEPAEPLLCDPEDAAQKQWLHAGYLFLALLLFLRLAYLGSGTIQLSKDEAYQWLWSKHLDWSYFSKPPLIAWLQFVSAGLWGDTEFGVRFFAPVISAVLGLAVLRFFAREGQARIGTILLLAVTAAPLLAVGGVLFTVDAPLVLFCVLAMLRGWQAVQAQGRTADWAWVGIWLGLAFLSKYTGLALWVSFFLFMALDRTARRHLKRPGPYLGLALTALCAVPVIYWNAKHDWITLAHLHDRAGLDKAWRPTLRFFFDFTLSQLALLNPVFFTGMVWAAVASLRRRRRDRRLMYFLAMGAPLYFGYWLYTFRTRVLPNWIAPAVPPLFIVMALYAESVWRNIRRWAGPALKGGLALGLTAVALAHNSDWIAKLIGRPLPPRLDPLRRVRYWSDLAELVGRERAQLEAAAGKPAFIIGAHYGITSLITFYLPEAKRGVPDRPLVFYIKTDRPHNQFYFWPSYESRRGWNAIYVSEEDEPEPPPPELLEQFESVENMGMRDFVDKGRVMRRVQLFKCLNLR